MPLKYKKAVNKINMIIKEIQIDLDYVSNEGQQKDYKITGDNGSIFSVVVEKIIPGAATQYYDFNTSTFAESYKRLKNKAITTNSYSGSITFPAGVYPSSIPNGPIKYVISVYAEEAFGTFQDQYSEVRFPDGVLDINNSKGSNSNLLQKVLYQFPETVVSLSSISASENSGFVGFLPTPQTFNVQRGSSSGKINFSHQIALHSTKTGFIKRTPKLSDLVCFLARTLGEPVVIKGDVTYVANSAESATKTMSMTGSFNSTTLILNSTSGVSVGDTIVGFGQFENQINGEIPVIVVSVVDETRIHVSKALQNTSGGSVSNINIIFENRTYRRWEVENIQGFQENMIPYGSYLASGTFLSRYVDETEITTEKMNSNGEVVEETTTVTNINVPAVDTLGYTPTYEYGNLKSQKGYITFNQPQLSTIRNGYLKFYAYGEKAIEIINNSKINLQNLNIELSPVTTTVNDASNADGNTAQTAIVVASATGIKDDVSVMSGVNVTSTSIDPLVTNISGTTLTVSPAQYLQHGETLTFTGAGQVFTITGDIDFQNVDSASFGIAFDVDKFITAS